MTHTLLPENWNYTYYEHADLKALVSIAQDYDSNGNENLYYLTSIIDGENNDLFQAKHDNLDSACLYLNRKYHGIWELKSLEKGVSSGGCSTCVAH